MAKTPETIEQGKRLKRARESAGFETATDGWEAVRQRTKCRISKDAYIQHENGTRSLKGPAQHYAQAYGVAPAWLIWGTEEWGGKVPVVGYVGASAAFHGLDDHEMGAGLDEIDRPPGAPANAVAVVVRGDSMHPAIKDGWVLVYWDKREDPSDFVGEDCFVRLKDGQTLVKTLERGSAPGRWTLSSINSSTQPIRDVEVEWAAVIEIRLRKADWRGQ